MKKRNFFFFHRHMHIDVPNIDRDWVTELCKYYHDLGHPCFSPLDHILLRQYTGLDSFHFVSFDLKDTIKLRLNGSITRKYYKDKNTYEIYGKVNRPKELINNINGINYTQDKRVISEKAILNELRDGSQYVIKPSLEAHGLGVRMFLKQGDDVIIGSERMDVDSLIGLYRKDFLIQEKIVQSPITAEFHPKSVNTLRLLTFRWKGHIRYLGGFLRVGVGNSITDNAGGGGFGIGIDDDGRLGSFGVSNLGQRITRHPDSGCDFSIQRHIPEFDRYKQLVTDLHVHIPHLDLVRWDIAVAENGEPLFIENNFGGEWFLTQATRNQPLFGELSDEVIPFLIKNYAKSSETESALDEDRTAFHRILKHVKRNSLLRHDVLRKEIYRKYGFRRRR